MQLDLRQPGINEPTDAQLTSKQGVIPENLAPLSFQLTDLQPVVLLFQPSITSGVEACLEEGK